MTDFNYRFLGERRMLANFSQAQFPFNRKRGDYLPLEEEWEIQQTYVSGDHTQGLELLLSEKGPVYRQELS